MPDAGHIASTTGGGTGSAAQIVTRGLTKTFAGKPAVTALTDIDLVVPRGQFCCIVGRSGCGKTTLLRIVAGLDTHSGGRLELLHYDRTKPLDSMIFQEQSIFPWMTVADNIAYGLRRRGVPAADRRERVGYFVDKVGLTQFRDAYPHQLSGGMKQRVAIARAFANDPEILLMDEPFAALDEQNKALLQEELLRIWEETRKTVLFITHSIDEAVVLGDRVLVMTARPGRIKADLAIELVRPRSVYGLRRDPAYGELVARIWEELREEVMGAKASAAGSQSP